MSMSRQDRPTGHIGGKAELIRMVDVDCEHGLSWDKKPRKTTTHAERGSVALTGHRVISGRLPRVSRDQPQEDRSEERESNPLLLHTVTANMPSV